MKISRLLELDTTTEVKLNVPQSFGDAYLINKNSLYRSIRRQVQVLGFKFSKQFGNSFNALPLSQLETILKEKTIPYTDNVTVLKDIEAKIPNVCDWDEVTDNLKKNYLFHESCHAVARSYSEKTLTQKLTQTELVIKLLVEESFANTCELLGIVDVNDSAHRIFYEANSYCYMENEKTNIKNLIQDLGFDFIFYFTLLNYMHSNFLYEKISEKNIESVVQFIVNNNLAETVQSNVSTFYKRLKLISRICLELNPRFRFVTTTFYFHLQKINISHDELAQTNFLQEMGRNPHFLVFLKKLKVTDFA
ncbi:MAG: hypothetical protein ACXVAX_07285 [Pseudobdellovibrio sp.]